MSRSSSAAVPSSGAIRSRGASARSARAASEVAPSPSSGAIASAAAAAASASSSAWRRRSRWARSLSSSSGAMPSVASTSACSSASACRRGTGVAGQVFVAPLRRFQLPPGQRGFPTPLELLGAAERVEHVELERRARKPPLLELPRHRDQALCGGRNILARDRASPRIRSRPPVGEHPPREHEPRLAFGSQLGERGQFLVVEEPVRNVELRLDVGLGRVGADRGSICLCAEKRARWPARRSSSPAPVSPVTAFSPGPNERSASRMRTRFSIRSLRSKTRHPTRPIEKPRITGRRCCLVGEEASDSVSRLRVTGGRGTLVRRSSSAGRMLADLRPKARCSSRSFSSRGVSNVRPSSPSLRASLA